MPHVILFEQPNFRGAHKHVFGEESNLNAADDNHFNDNVNSLIVIDGFWAFFRHSGFNGQYAQTLGWGLYPMVGNFDIQPNDMSSLRPIAPPPTAMGNPIPGQVILFEHANFHGAHKHVLTAEPSLNLFMDGFFNDRVSSIAVLDGNWTFFRHGNFIGQYARALGWGLYPWVENFDIQNDDMSSLRPVADPMTQTGTNIRGDVILFEHANFHGAHKHVFNEESNLNAADDNFFNDRVSSIAVHAGSWAFFRHSGFNGQYAQTLGLGLYPFVGNLDIQNDDMSSLRVI